MSSVVKIEPMTLAHAGPVVRHLQNSYRADEPLSRAIKFGVGESEKIFQDMFESALVYGASFVALEQQEKKVVGVSLSSIKAAGESPFLFVKKNYPRKLQSELSFYGQLESEYYKNLKTDVTKLLRIHVISVDGPLRRQGIATRLIQESLDAAKQLGCQVAVVIATATEAQQLFEGKFHFREEKSVRLHDYIDPLTDSNIFLSVPRETNEFAKLMSKELKSG